MTNEEKAAQAAKRKTLYMERLRVTLDDFHAGEPDPAKRAALVTRHIQCIKIGQYSQADLLEERVRADFEAIMQHVPPAELERLIQQHVTNLLAPTPDPWEESTIKKLQRECDEKDEEIESLKAQLAEREAGHLLPRGGRGILARVFGR